MAAAEPSQPRQRPGPRTLEEDVDALGEDAPWLVLYHRGQAIKCEHYDAPWAEIVDILGVSTSQYRRWAQAYRKLRAAGKVT